MKAVTPFLLCIILLISSCQNSSDSSPSVQETPPQASTAFIPREAPDISSQLPADASVDQIAAHLLEAEHAVSTTNALPVQFPDMTRETAYQVQLAALENEGSGGEQLIGWKMGGTNVPLPEDTPDPSFAYMLTSDQIADKQTIGSNPYIGDSVMVEAEIAFIIGKDLEGPTVTEEQLRDGVESVAGAIELISIRLANAPDGTAPSMNHMIAARLSHAGVIVGDERIPLSEFDLENEQVVTTIDGEEAATGRSNEIMNTNPFDALMWIANALPQHGRFLRAGDVVITGSLYTNPTLKPGQEAVVRFSSLGRLSVSLSHETPEAE